MPVPRTLVGAWQEMRLAWQRQKRDPDYEFDTPLPATANPEPVAADDEVRDATDLERSIGELAPAGLQER